MSDITTPTEPDQTQRTIRNVAVLVAAQAFLGAQMPMLFVVAGLAGLMIAPSPWLATIPISLIVFGSMITAPWLSPLMQKHGRRLGFLIGCMGGAAGAAISAFGLWIDNFWIFLAGSLVTGIYMSAQGFYRFAAADTASEAFRPKAISYVMAGGLISALIGPRLVTLTSEAWVIPFIGTYITVVMINLAGTVLFAFLDLPAPKVTTQQDSQGRSRAELLRDPKIVVAVICAAVSYSLMNLMMTSTPLAVMACGFSGDLIPGLELGGLSETELRELFLPHASNIVSAHVIAMFAPSFFTGHLIARFGSKLIIATGLLCLAAAGAVALTGVELYQFYTALVLLGLGWNFGFIGATALLTASHSVAERGTVQGMNDFVVFGCVTLASLCSGVLMNSGGGDAIAGWTSVNLAMVPFLLLAAGALIYLSLSPKNRTA